MGTDNVVQFPRQGEVGRVRYGISRFADEIWSEIGEAGQESHPEDALAFSPILWIFVMCGATVRPDWDDGREKVIGYTLTIPAELPVAEFAALVKGYL